MDVLHELNGGVALQALADDTAIIRVAGGHQHYQFLLRTEV